MKNNIILCLILLFLLIPSIGAAEIRAHPYLLFHDISETPGYQYRTDAPWNSWEKTIIRGADSCLKNDYGGDLGAYNRIIYRAGNARTLGLAYQITKKPQYAEKAKEVLLHLNAADPPTKTDRASALSSLSLAYDWVQPTLDVKNDTIIRDSLATLGDTVFRDLNDEGKNRGYITFADYHGQAYPDMGIIGAALEDYKNPNNLKLSSTPADWNKVGTEYLFEKDQLHKYNRSLFSFGFDESSGKHLLGSYKSYVMDDMVTWFQVYSHTYHENIFEKYPAAKRAFTSEIWESLPNQYSNNFVTNGNTLWAYHKGIINLLPDAEKPAVLNHLDRVTKTGILPYSSVWGGASTGGISSTLLYCTYGNYESVARAFPSEISHLDPASVYQVIRKNWDDDSDWLSLITFNVQTNSNRDMAHQDQLSIEYYSRGDLLLADAGEPKHILGGSYGTTEIHHNTIAIEDPQNPFPVSPWSGSSAQGIFKGNAQGLATPVEIGAIIQKPWMQLIQTHAMVSKVINGNSSADYIKLKSPVSYERTIVYPDSGYFIIIDRMESADPWIYRNIFRPASLMVTPTVDANKDGKYQMSEIGHVNGDLVIAGTPYDWKTLEFRVETPTHTKTESLIWTTTNPYGKKVNLTLFSSPASAILIEKNTGRIGGYEAKSEVATPIIYLKPDAGTSLYRVTALLSSYADENEKTGQELAVSGVGHAILVVTPSSRDIIYAGSGDTSFEKYHTDADVVFIREEGDTSIFTLLNASYLKSGDDSVISFSRRVVAVSLKKVGESMDYTIQGNPDLDGTLYGRPVDKSKIEEKKPVSPFVISQASNDPVHAILSETQNGWDPVAFLTIFVKKVVARLHL